MTISIDDRIFNVTDDIKGLRLPMPPPLEWVNAYFLRDDKGWFVVDTGYNTPESRAVLDTMVTHHLDGLPVIGVIATHYHPDHVGQAGWLCNRFNCPLYMTHTEWLLARWLSTDKTASYLQTVSDYYRNAATPDDVHAVIVERGNTFIRTSDEVPASYHRLEAGQVLKIGKRSWKILIGRGHAPEMVMLYDAEGKFLISADQVVARITPNISIWAFDTEGNPLKEFMDTSTELPKRVPDDVTILPGHGRPFNDFHDRIGTYVPFHEKRLTKLLENMTHEPQTLYALHKILFPRELSPRDYVFALGETHAHVNWLIANGDVERIPGDAILFRKR